MVTVLPPVESFGAAFGKALGGAAKDTVAGYYQGKNKAQEFAQQIALEKAKAEFKQKKDTQENKEKALQGLDQSIDEMLSLADSPGIGLSGNLNITPDAYYNRGRLQTLKGELLNYYKSLFPRGLTQQEFKKLESDYLPSWKDTVSGMKGKLEGFKDLIQRKLEQQNNTGNALQGKKTKGKVAFNINNPEHKAKRNQLMKKFNNDREKVQEVLDREFE